MKKELTIFLIAIVFISMVSFVLADENSTDEVNETEQPVLISAYEGNSSNVTEPEIVSNETLNETKIMHDHHGAEVRVLQLQKAIKKMILHATAVKNVVANKGNNTAELENIIAEMQLLLDEAENITTNDLNASVQQFVDIKEDAIALRKEFKEAARKYLTKEDKDELKEAFKNIDKTEMKEYKERIRNQIREFNKNRIERFMNITRIDDDGLRKRMRNNETNATEALRELKKKYSDMDKDEKEEVKKNMRGNISEEKIAHMNKILEMKQERAEKIYERAEERAEKLSEMGKPILAKRMEIRAEMFEHRAENIQVIKNKISERTNGN